MISATQRFNAKLMWFVIVMLYGAVFGLGTCWANETPVIFVVSNPHLSPMHAPLFVARELGYWESEGVDVEIRSLLTTATAKENVAPETLSAGFRALLQDITKGIVDFIGVEPANRILVQTRHNLRKQFPSLTYEIEWESLQAGGI